MTVQADKKLIDSDLHLVDFNNISVSMLKDDVEHAIAAGHKFLDELDNTHAKSNTKESNIKALDPEQALIDIVKFDHLNLALDRSWGIVSHLNSVMSNDDIRDVHHSLLPSLSAYGTRVGQNKPLFERYQTINYDADFMTTLTPARQRAIELAIRNFKLSGVALPEDDQHQFAKIQAELSTLSAKFSDNVLDATQAFFLPLTSDNLSGLPQSSLDLLAAAGEDYKDKLAEDEAKKLPTPYYVATLDMPVYIAIMTYADDRTLRETLYKAYVTRASEFDTHKNKKGESLDNSEIMSQILQLRGKKAKLLGFDNYAQVSLSKKMADSVEQVEDFLLNLSTKASVTAKQDLNQLKMQAELLGIEAKNLQPWDNAYLAEKVKQHSFKLSQEEVRPYFPLPKVIEGLFSIVNKLFEIRVVEDTDSVPTWHSDVRFYKLFDADDSLIGGFYFDLYARTGKRGGAWMSGFQPKYRLDSKFETHLINETVDKSVQLPVCFMVCNFTPANGDKPSLLTHNEVTTLFHEFGHGLHHLLTEVEISDIAGVNGVEWDAVELPSQFLENWAWEEDGIQHISAHVDTGAPLPKAMLDALLSAKNFQSGMQTLRQIEFALFDLRLHAQYPAPDYYGILSTLNKVREQVAVTTTPEYNRFANGFSHIFAGGYAAGYYSYKWAELLSADAFSRFEEEGVFNIETGKAFRKYILSVGGSLPAKVNFEEFRGRAASIEALLRHSGFLATQNTSAS